MTNQIATQQNSITGDSYITLAIVNLESTIRSVAQSNLDSYLEQHPEVSLTALQREAVIVGEELAQINGVDLAAVIMRAARVIRIRNEGLAEHHPEHNTLEAMARASGVSASELSFTIDLVDVVFPWLGENGHDVPILWETMGKSNFQEITPLMKHLILNTAPGHASLREALRAILQRAQNTLTENYVADGGNAQALRLTEEQVREQALTELVNLAMNTTTNRGLREQLRGHRQAQAARPGQPTQQPLVNHRAGRIIMDRTGARYFVMPMTGTDEFALVARRFPGIDTTVVLQNELNIPRNLFEE